MSIKDTLEAIESLPELRTVYCNSGQDFKIEIVCGSNDLKSLAVYVRKLAAAALDARNYLDYAKAATNLSFAKQQVGLAQLELQQALKEGEL